MPNKFLGFLRALLFWRRHRRLERVARVPRFDSTAEERMDRLEILIATLTVSVTEVAASSLEVSELAKRALASPRPSAVGGSLLTVNMGGSSAAWMLNAVVYFWLILATVTAAGVLMRVFAGGGEDAIPNLDVMERIVGWLGVPAAIIIYAELKIREAVARVGGAPIETS